MNEAFENILKPVHRDTMGGTPGSPGTPGSSRLPGAGAVPPVARVSVRVRAAVMEDVGFIDQLQRMHTHMVGWFPTKQIEGNIAEGRVVIAEVGETMESAKPQAAGAIPGGPGAGERIGYCIARDQYMKRDDVGIVYQLNVLPLRQRHLVGAMLIKGVFERAAYGCRLFSCWCAQDIQANYFWESIGFVPLAFRTGSRTKQRIHIFWQRRVRENDDVTPYWFPSQTTGGALAEDRIVLPIPPGTHWRDAKPILLPGLPMREAVAAPTSAPGMPKLLPGGAPVKGRPEHVVMTKAQAAAVARSKSKVLGAVPVGKAAIMTSGGVRYIDRADAPPEVEMIESKPKVRRPKRERQKNDPKYVAAARELRDRYLEMMNTERLLPGAHGKYDVSRVLSDNGSRVEVDHRLDAA